MACVFCQIAKGEIDAYRVLEDEHTVAFLDSKPLFPGHCLLIPKLHHETLPDLPAELLPAVFANAQILARAMETGLEAEGSLVAINNRVSQSVPHLHIHVVPRRKKDGLKGFFWPRTPYRDENEIRRVQQALRAAITSHERS